MCRVKKILLNITYNIFFDVNFLISFSVHFKMIEFLGFVTMLTILSYFDTLPRKCDIKAKSAEQQELRDFNIALPAVSSSLFSSFSVLARSEIRI